MAAYVQLIIGACSVWGERDTGACINSARMTTMQDVAICVPSRTLLVKTDIVLYGYIAVRLLSTCAACPVSAVSIVSYMKCCIKTYILKAIMH